MAEKKNVDKHVSFFCTQTTLALESRVRLFSFHIFLHFFYCFFNRFSTYFVGDGMAAKRQTEQREWDVWGDEVGSIAPSEDLFVSFDLRKRFVEMYKKNYFNSIG